MNELCVMLSEINEYITCIINIVLKNLRRRGVEKNELQRICARSLHGNNYTTDDQLKQKHTAEMWTSLTEGQDDHNDIKNEVGN